MEVLSGRIGMAVADLPTSRHFYEQVLGLRVAREFGAGGEVTGVVYFCGGMLLEVGERRSADDGPRDPNMFLWLQVPDVAAEHEHLVAEGVVFAEPPRRMPWGLVECWLADPDGLRIALVEVPEDHPLRRRVE